MKQHYKTLMTLLFLALSVSSLRAQITVDATLGTTSASYTTLKAACDAINIGTHMGAIDIRVHAGTTETASAILVESGNVSGAIYTSILIRPADTATTVKTITTATASIVLLDLNGSDNVIIDGRPLSTGTLSLLEFNNTVNSATNITIRLRGGATSNALRYIRSTNPGAATAGNANIHIVTQPGFLIPNGDNAIANCIIQGGRSAILIDDTLSSGVFNPIAIRNNSIFNWGLAGINVSSGTVATNFARIETLIVDSNLIYHDVAFTSAAASPRAVAFAATNSTKTYAFTFTKNRIYGLKSNVANTSIFGMLITPGTTGASLINIINNSIVIVDANNTVNVGAIGGVNGITFQGTGSANCKVLHNTVRIGGAAVGGTVAALTIRSVCLGKFNSGTANALTVKNNIFINTRTGGASTTNAHMGAWYNTNTAGTHDLNYNNYTGTGYIVGWGGTVYGSVAGYQVAAVGVDVNSIQKATNFTNTTQPYLTGTSLADADLSAVFIPTVTSDIDNASRGTLQTAVYKGAYEAPNLFITNDLSTTIIYTYGKIPTGTTEAVRARIRNNGSAPVMSPTITMNIYGANTTTLTVSLTGISAGIDTIITFPSYTPTNLGFDSIRVFVPTGDQNTTNDTAIWVRENTLNALSYARPFQAQSGNLGNNGFGELLAKFNTPVPNFVNQVNVNFTSAAFTGPWPFQVVIYPDSGGTSGPKKNAIWVSTTQQTVNGIVNISIPSIPVSGNFYMGIRQTSANNIGFAYQTETPIRTNTMYYRQDPTSISNALVANWNDFAPNNSFRFMIEPRLKINDDIGIIDVLVPGPGCVSANATQTVSVVIQNLGLLSQNFGFSAVTVKGTITSPSAVTTALGPVVISGGVINSDDTLSVALTSSYNMSAPGSYTIKAWTEYSVDNNRINDTIPSVIRTVTTATALPYSQNFNASTIFPAELTTNRFIVSTGNGVLATNTARVNLFNTNPFFANAFITSSRLSNITATSQLRFDYRITNSLGATPTVLTNVDSMNVYISTDCGVSYAKVLTIVGSGHIPSTAFAGVSIPLSAYTGQDIRVKIQLDWNGTTNDANVDIDNIRVLNVASDISATSSAQPCAALILGSSAVAPTAVFKNAGSTTLTSVNVNYSISGPATYSGTGTIASLAAGSSTAVTFTPTFNPTIAGTYTAKIYSALAGDSDPLNDTLYYTFSVINTTTTNSGNALSFNGTTSAEIANSPTINMSGNALTLQAWINRNTTGTGTRVILSKDSSIIKGQYALWLNAGNNLVFTLTTSLGANAVVSTNTVPTGTYTHVAATYDGTIMSLYINGNLEGTTPQSGTIVPNQVNLKVGQNYNNERFVGEIDEVQLWNTAVDVHTLRSNMHKRQANASSPNMLGYYRFDEGTGTTSIDASGNCNNVTLTAGATPTWIAATYPLATAPVTNIQYITFDGPTVFTGTGVTINYSGVSGQDSVYVHKIPGVAMGTSPATIPGGVTAVHGNTWLTYRYGSGTLLGANITFALGPNNLNSGVVVSDLSLFNRANGINGGWTLQNSAASAVSFGAQTVTFAQTSSNFYAKQLSIGAINNPLPVKLIYFNGKRSNADVQLTWVTASETDNAAFTVERSTDGKSFEKVANVDGKGNSNEATNYTLMDENAFANANSKMLYYRLVQTDFSGKETISQTVTVNADNEDETITALYPNPFTNELTLTIDSKIQTAAKIQVMDIAGKTVVTLTQNLNTGMNTIETAQLSQLPKGIYMVQLNINGQLTNHKLVKQ